MFKDQRSGDQNHRRKIKRAELRHDAEYNQGDKHHQMQHLGEPQSARNPEPHGERMQAFATIEIVILDGINQIESSHPTDHSESQNEWRLPDSTSLRAPGGDGRDSERETEKKMCRVGKTFGRRRDRKSTRLNSSHMSISYAVFCLKKK